MISDNEKQQIRSLVSSPQWQTIERFAQLLQQKIANEPINVDFEWTTVRDCLLREGKINGIRQLLQELLTNSND